MPERLKLDISLCNNAAAKRASRRLGIFYDEVLSPCKIRATQYALLDQIMRLKSPSMTDLALALVLDRSALSHTIRPLERDQLIALQPSRHDRRVKIVTLTDLGKQKLEACGALWQRAQAQFEAAFGPENAADLRKTMDLLASLNLDARRALGAGPATAA